MSTSITVSGVVVTEPKFLTTSAGVPIASFRLAASERRFDRASNSWKYTASSFYTVSSYRYLAENARASIAKGDHVVATGRIRVREWTAGEKSGTDVEIDAEALGHDLSWGTSVYTRRARAAEAGTGSTEAGFPAATGTGLLSADPAAMPGGEQDTGSSPVRHWPVAPVPVEPDLVDAPF